MDQPEGESLRRAVRWISGKREEDPGRSLGSLVDEATLRFDLSPKQASYLLDFYARARRDESGPEA